MNHLKQQADRLSRLLRAVRPALGDIDDTWLPTSDFLEKPVDLDVLRDRVDALLQWAEGAQTQ